MGLLEFASLLQELKDVKRTGWVIHEVKEPESVSDHSYVLAVLSMLYAEERNLDVEKCMKMALIHDIGEVYTKDIATRLRESDQTVTNAEKKRLEEEATKRVLSTLPEKYQSEFLDLWKEYEAGKSEEAKLVKDMDIMERALQACKYKNRTEADLGEFFQEAERDIKGNYKRELLYKIKKEYEGLG